LPCQELWQKESFNGNCIGSQDSSFNSSPIHKTRLAEWDLNVPSTGTLPTQSSTTIEYGMPTPRTPLNLLDMGYMVEKAEAYMERADCAAWDSEDTYLS
jgi:hypothetical protein